MVNASPRTRGDDGRKPASSRGTTGVGGVTSRSLLSYNTSGALVSSGNSLSVEAGRAGASVRADRGNVESIVAPFIARFGRTVSEGESKGRTLMSVLVAIIGTEPESGGS